MRDIVDEKLGSSPKDYMAHLEETLISTVLVRVTVADVTCIFQRFCLLSKTIDVSSLQ